MDTFCFSFRNFNNLLNNFETLFKELPRIDTLDEYRPNLITEIYDINREVIAELFVERRDLVPLSQIPVDLQNAVIAVEDQRFFKHWGADLHAIARAMLANLKHRQIVEGGSTITQQLSKALYLTRERTIKRKIKELLSLSYYEY